LWGKSVRIDHIKDFFKDRLESYGLVDVAPKKIVLTWTINRVGGATIHKRLDRFVVHNSLLLQVPRYKSWVDLIRVLDHFPIMLELELDETRPSTPFNFNPRWVKEEAFINLVKEY
jgi:hypothetical protein